MRQRLLQHHGIEVTVTAGVDLHGDRADIARAFGVEAGGDITVDHANPQLRRQRRDGALDQRGLARTG